MLSLPSLQPQSAHNLWYPSLSTNPYTNHPSQDPTTNPHHPHHRRQSGQHHHHHHQNQHQNNHDQTNHEGGPNHNNHNHNQYHHNQQQYRHSHNHPLRTPLTTLLADENAIEARKANIRRFGCGWLRPPGVSKTLQVSWDEKAEREEQEAVAAREAALLEAQAMAEEQERLGAAGGGGEGEQVGGGEDGEEGMVEGDEGMGEGERDLDAEIPDADVDVDADVDEDEDIEGEEGDAWASSNEDEDDNRRAARGGGGGGGGGDENGDLAGELRTPVRRRLIPQRPGAVGFFGDEEEEGGLSVGEGDGDYADDAAVGMEGQSGYGFGTDGARDLDEDVPEAGSYQHTDTDVEDMSDADDSGWVGHATRQSGRLSGGIGSGGLGSSVFGSSPVAVRRSAGGPGRSSTGRRSGGTSVRRGGA
ncbi:hypothetical protein MMC25_007902 [Agyrium rufum]|nr:hypothetical protein [Agyrium rufum]